MALTYVLLGLIVLSFVGSGALTLIKGSLPLSIVLWIGGVGVAAVLVAVSGVFWMQLANPEAFAGQGGGFAFVLVLPFFIGTGILIGAWSVAWGYWLAPGGGNSLWFQLIGLLGSSIVGPLVAWALTFPIERMGLWLTLLEPNDKVSPLVLAALIGSCLTAILVHGLTRLMATLVL
ncbi:hypothetical protein C8255_06860 [filamentous cyanobacterium CCP3]|nr:hypothetical protein C8255_06860 [filamentous cyanobacterium CCP3]